MNQIQEAQNSAMNQIKYIADNTKDNILDFNKKAIQQNPFNSMQYNWQVAQARKAFVFWVTLPVVIAETFWTTWAEVYRQPQKAPYEKEL